jgi:hypothetical protein
LLTFDGLVEKMLEGASNYNTGRELEHNFDLTIPKTITAPDGHTVNMLGQTPRKPHTIEHVLNTFSKLFNNRSDQLFFGNIEMEVYVIGPETRRDETKVYYQRTNFSNLRFLIREDKAKFGEKYGIIIKPINASTPSINPPNAPVIGLYVDAKSKEMLFQLHAYDAYSFIRFTKLLNKKEIIPESIGFAIPFLNSYYFRPKSYAKR